MRKTTLIYLLLFMFILFSCSEEDSTSQIDLYRPDPSLSIENQRKVIMMREVSQILGKMITSDSSSYQIIVEAMNDVHPDADVVSFANLVGDQENISEFESKLSYKIPSSRRSKQSYSNTFREKFIRVLKESKESMLALDSLKNPGGKSNRYSFDSPEELVEFIIKEGLEIHIPFEAKFNPKAAPKVITTSYHPIVNDQENEGFVYMNGKMVSKIDKINNVYSNENQTMVILPSSKVPDPGSAELPPVNYVEIQKNVDASEIPDDYAMGTYIPCMRCDVWYAVGLFSLAYRAVFARASGELTIDETGPKPSASTFIFPEVWFWKWDCWFKTWKEVNFQWDPNWASYEKNHQVVLARRYLFTIREVNLSVTVGVEGSGTFSGSGPSGSVTPSVSATVSTTVYINNAIFKANKELDRKQILASNFGGDVTGYYRQVGDRKYTLRGIGPLQFYFKNYLYSTAGEE